MKVLVTGAAGQIGCRAARQLLQRDHEVRGTVLPDDPCLPRLEGLDLEIIEGDLTDPAFCERAVDGVDGVIHTANLVGKQHYENNLACNLAVTRAVAARADTLERYVYVSSSGVFPNGAQVLAPLYHPVDELHPKRPMEEYSLSKLIGEEIVHMFARQTGLRAAIVRPSGVVSGDQALGRWTCRFVSNILQMGQRNPGSSLYQPDGAKLWLQVEEAADDLARPCSVTDLDGRPWLYRPNDARDVAHALVCAIESEAATGEDFNIGAPEVIPYPAAAVALAEMTGRDPVEVRLPVRWITDHCITKAKSLIDYRPQGDLRTMLKAAQAFAAGEHDGYDWPA